MPCPQLKKFLDDNSVKFVTISHSASYTAQEIAASAHIKGNEFAKSVVVKIDGKMAIAALPANYKVDFKALKKAIGCNEIRLANEYEFKDKFKNCDVGAMPPFGNLAEMDTYAAESLTKVKQIAFNSGIHTEIIRMAYDDYQSVVKPKIIKFSSKNKV